MKHEKLTILLLALWAMCFARVVQAATIQEFMGPYDQDLTMWAAVTAVLGGLLRTIFSLQSDARRVLQLLPEAGWDALKALVAGMAAFFAIQAMRSSGWAIPAEVRFGAVLVAGCMRFTALFWMRDVGAEWLAARRAQIVAKAFEELTPPPPKDPS